MSATLKSFPFKAPDPGLGVGALFRKGSVVTLFAQVAALQQGWARRVRLQLASSIGSFSVEGNDENLPAALKAGDWVRLRTIRRHGEGDTPLTLLRLTPAMPDCKAAWVPTALYHRNAHVQRLRRLLDALEPSLQLVFLLALNDAQLQRRFFWRVGAADHHGYPGGLFDQSVEAAERAWADGEGDSSMRGLAAIAALLFDLGKAGDDTLAEDSPRLDGSALALTPHRLTPRRLERALEQVRRIDPRCVDQLEVVLFAEGPEAASPELQRAARLTRQAVCRSWQLPGHD